MSLSVNKVIGVTHVHLENVGFLKMFSLSHY